MKTNAQAEFAASIAGRLSDGTRIYPVAFSA
jgi:hypothetical protein